VKEFDNVMHDFFIKLEGLAAPRATSVVRNLVGDRVELSLRDTEEGQIELPTYYTKRSLYKKLAADCNWEINFDSNGIYKKNNKRKVDDSTKGKKIPSWPTFHLFWKTYYPHIKIPKPREDICEDCHKFVNYHKTAAAKKKRRAEDAALDDEEGIENEDEAVDGSVATDSVEEPSLSSDSELGEF
jgi:hypothetical protein